MSVFTISTRFKQFMNLFLFILHKKLLGDKQFVRSIAQEQIQADFFC